MGKRCRIRGKRESSGRAMRISLCSAVSGCRLAEISCPPHTTLGQFCEMAASLVGGDPLTEIHLLFGTRVLTGPSTLASTGLGDGSIVSVVRVRRRLIVTSPAEGTSTKVWDSASGKCVTTLPGRSACFSPDGSSVLTACEDMTAKVWSIASNECTMKVQLQAEITMAMFSPSGSSIITGSPNDAMKMWKVVNGECTLTLPVYVCRPQGTYSRAAAFSWGGSDIATVSEEIGAKVWNTTNGKLSMSLPHYRIRSVAFSPNGDSIVTSSQGTIKLWNATSGEFTRTLEIHRDGWNFNFSPDGGSIVTPGFDTAEVRSLVTGKCTNWLRGHTLGVWNGAFSPDGTSIVTAASDGCAKVWSAASGECTMTLVHGEVLTSASFSPAGV